ncbi:Carbohydrate-binding protein [Phytophthora palmivora]|uniref:Carbohydrate-binding protein n=1 Tax=Phytophthora palmivora TaxID=4796 RepID=A0A2P4Y8C4_9STRA|nr:Carbohydrate-binding protein [Phytophthora palmivora]
MLRFALAAAGLLVYLAGVQASVSVTISNSCSESVALYDNSATTTLASGSSTTRTLANGYVGMFRNGVSDEATLAEISVDSDGTPWYDISIIPPDSGSCTSLSACQSQTGKTGFNTAMQISPQDNIGDDTCEVLTCEADGCSDAYQYPSDDTKTHTCPEGTSFEVTFCPGGSGTSTSTTTTSSTSTPTPTTATPTPTTATPTPTTAAPTATPTPTPTPTPTEAPVSSSASTSGSTGIQVQTKNYSGNFTLSSTSASASAGSASNAGVETAGDATKSTTTLSDSTTAQTTGTTATTDSKSSDDVVKVTTKSSDNSTSSLTYFIVIGGCVAGIASGGFIYAVQQKKKALDMEAKSPMDGDRSCRDVSVLVSTPDSLSARL